MSPQTKAGPVQEGVNVVVNPTEKKMNVPLPEGGSNNPQVADAQRIHAMAGAAAEGKLPTNSQTKAAVDKVLQSDALHSARKDGSVTGAAVATDVQQILTDVKGVVDKNKDNALQDLVYHSNQAVKKSQELASQHMDPSVAADAGDKQLRRIRETSDNLYQLSKLLVSSPEFRGAIWDLKNVFQAALTGAFEDAARRSERDAPDAADAMRRTSTAANKAANMASQQVKDGRNTPDAEKIGKEVKKDVDGDKKAEQTKNDAQEKTGKMEDRARDHAAELAGGLADKSKPLKEVAGERREALQKDAQELQSTASAVQKQGKAALSNLQESFQNISLSDEDQDRIVSQLKQVLLKLKRRPEYSRSIQSLVEVISTVGDLFQQFRNQAQQVSEQLANDPDVLAARADTRKVFENLAGGKSLEKFFDLLNQFATKAKENEKLRSALSGLNDYVISSVEKPERISDQNWAAEGKKLAKNLRDAASRDEYKQLLQSIFEEASDYIDRLARDKVFNKLAQDIERLASDIFLDGSGNPTFKPELLRDAQLVIPKLAREMQYIPVPRIEYSDAEYDLVLDNIVLIADDIVPKHLRISTKTELDSTSGKDVAETFIQIKVDHIGLRGQDIKFYYKKRSGLIKLSDYGYLNFNIEGGDKPGLALDVIAASDFTGDDKAIYAKRCTATIENASIKIRDSKHDFLYTILNPIIKSKVKTHLTQAFEENIQHLVVRLDDQLQSARQATEEKLAGKTEEPKADPNWGSKAYTPISK